MNELKKLSNEALISSARAAVLEERRITALVIEHLTEIDRRKIYLEDGSTILFVFCMKQFGYSENEAHTRISAMRLARDVPESVQAIESGRLSLTNLSKVQSYFGQMKKSGMALTVESKAEVLKQVEGLSTRECEKYIASQDGMPSTFSRVFQIDSEIEADLRRIREIWGNQYLTDTELLRKMCKLVLTRIDPAREVRSVAKSGARKKSGDVDVELIPAEFDTPASRYIPADIRRKVWRRDGGTCTHSRQGRRCESKYALQFHHLDPYGYGGVHTVENLVLLCRAHHSQLSGAA